MPACFNFFWEQMQASHPEAIGRPGTTHPPGEQRAVFLKKAAQEIESKKSRSEPLVPNMAEGEAAPWSASGS